ncbi:MAG: D-alanyl-D-alanine carboxypeptidase family protein [Cellulosilyticaceae bacterium]
MRLAKIGTSIIGIMCTLSIVTNVLATTKMDTIYSRGAVVIEKESKRILYERKSDEQMPMASTTKIMTCIVVLENSELDEIVTVSKKASRAPKVKIGLLEGEKQSLGDLLYSLMMESHNDSAVAIAEHVGGSVEEFCRMMTDKAHEIGATNTSFETPNGLDGENHYSTPYDMALIAAYALDNSKFIEITNTLDKYIPSKALEGSKAHQLVNKNRFIREYNGAIGVKTGYTSKAGHCFVGAAKQNDMTLIGVALGAGCDQAAKTRKYTDVKKMLTFGFENYKQYELIQENEEAGVIQVNNGQQAEVALNYNQKITLPLTSEEKEMIQIDVTLPDYIEAPVEVGQEVGEAKIVCGDEILATTKIITTGKVEILTWMDKVKRFLTKD